MFSKKINFLHLAIIILLGYLSFLPLKPCGTKTDTIIAEHFRIENAVNHINNISQKPHYVGSENHHNVQQYIIKELQNLGLTTEVQKTTITNQNNTFTQVENILAKIKGSSDTSKSLVVMSHYDSAPYSSRGSADAGSGVAVILEGMRAYLEQNTQPKNDIIILVTDAEEIGLLGAKAFVKKHAWANNVGAVINFEARGSSGSSYMLMETNTGNKRLIEHFKNAKTAFPNSNSLIYSIYKLLPNDTDLSVFRQDKNILGFNFAFIDNHFNYHTSLDNPANLSLDSLAHQAQYLLPMLNELSQIDLTKLQSSKDDVYLQIPFGGTFSYSFDSTLTISLLNLILFAIVVILGVKNKSLNISSILRSSLPLFKSLIMTALISFATLKFLYWLHPHYAEILQGFTYNGYEYIAFFSALAFVITIYFYRHSYIKTSAGNSLVIPIFLWLLISIVFALFLTGAHFFVLISLLSTLALAVNVLTKSIQTSLNLLILAPLILVFSPLFVQFPVALGLIILPFSGLLLVLFFSTFIHTVLSPTSEKINKWILLVPLIALYIYAETRASYNSERPLPDSLFYFQDQESQTAYMFTQDFKTDNWNKKLITEDRLNEEQLLKFRTTHWRRAKIVAKTENRNLPVSQINVLNDEILADRRRIKLEIIPQPNTNRLSIYNNSEINLAYLSINDEILHHNTFKKTNKGTRLTQIFVTEETSFVMTLEIAKGESLELTLIDTNPHLLSSKGFNVPERPKEFIPKPFIYSDSILIKQTIEL